MPISETDEQLIAAAKKEILQHFSVSQHRLATAILLESGEIVVGVNVEGSFGCIDVCAEQITLGIALSQGKNKIVEVVTVKHPRPEEEDREIKIVSPCGTCRELLYDYAPDAMVILKDNSEIKKQKVRELLPFRYAKR